MLRLRSRGARQPEFQRTAGMLLCCGIAWNIADVLFSCYDLHGRKSDRARRAANRPSWSGCIATAHSDREYYTTDASSPLWRCCMDSAWGIMLEQGALQHPRTPVYSVGQ